jgi:hypothetical protein
MTAIQDQDECATENVELLKRWTPELLKKLVIPTGFSPEDSA